MPLPDFLIHRYKDWKNNKYENNKETYKKLSNASQNPSALIISCCDSRVNVNSIFKANIGDYFIHRNIANLIPPYNKKDNETGTKSTIEYAIKVLKVPNIIILGHSNCGGIKHSFEKYKNKNNDDDFEFLNKWLETISPIYSKVDTNKIIEQDISLLEKTSIINSINNLLDYPLIKELINQKKLQLHGLWFDIGSGTLMNYNFISKNFETVEF